MSTGVHPTERLLIRLRQQARSQAELVSRRHQHNAATYPAPAMKAPRMHSLGGLLGTRGVGKTYTLAQWWREASEQPHTWSGFRFLQPLDLSLSPPDVPITLTLVHGLRDRIRDATAKRGHRARELRPLPSPPPE